MTVFYCIIEILHCERGGEMTMSAEENVMGMPTNHVDMGADELGYDGGSLSIATILTIVGVTIVARFAVRKE